MAAIDQEFNRHPPTGISVLIVGAGIGGTTSAIECWRRGCDVKIIERQAGKDPAGDHFSIGPSARRTFAHWPQLAAENKTVAYEPLLQYHQQSGEVAIPGAKPDLGFYTTEDGEKKAIDMYRVHRPGFADTLLRQLGRIGISVQYNQKVVEFYENADTGKGGVKLEDGTTMEADLVIAADGVGTKSHMLVSGHEMRAKGSGYAMYRTAFPVEEAMKDPIIAERWKLPSKGQTSVFELWAGGSEMAFYIWNNGDHMFWAILHPDDGSAQESWHNFTPVEKVAKYITEAGWPEITRRLVMSTPSGKVIDWKLLWRDPQKTWHSPAGRVIQVGDSAHTFLPSSGNGGTQAMEDSASLAACLELAGKENIPLALKVHNKLRFERVSCAQRLGVRNQTAVTKTNWDVIKANPKLLTNRHEHWIYRHDPEQYAVENFKACAEHILSGTPFENTNTPDDYVYAPWTIEGLLEAQARGDADPTDKWV